MSLWRVKHTLSPSVERVLVCLAAAYGVLAIGFASLSPFVVSTTADIRTVPPPVDLDTDAWPRHQNLARGYQYALPPDWAIDASDPDRLIADYGPDAARGVAGANRFEIQILDLGEDEEVADVAARELANLRPALYDVSVYGLPGLFAVVFEDGRLVRQVVYVPIGKRLFVFRGGAVDPAVFAAFISSVKFFPELLREPA